MQDVASSDVFARSGTYLLALNPRTPSALVQVPRAQVDVAAVPGGDLLQLTVSRPPSFTSPLISRHSSHIASVSVDGVTTFDASPMLPMFDMVALDTPSPMSLAWTGGGTGGTLIRVEVRAEDQPSVVTWRAFLDPQVTAVEFPALPPDLGVPTALSAFGSVTRYAVPGTSVADVVRTLDRDASLPSLAPLGGVSSTAILHTVGPR